MIAPNYETFLASKVVRDDATGFSISDSELNPILFDWQRAIVRWGLARGRAAFFEDCGLGKTGQALEWGWRVTNNIQRPVLTFAPLGVVPQTIDEDANRLKLNYGIKHVNHQSEITPGPGLWITNYQRMDAFDPSQFGGIILDESSIIKHQDGKTRKCLIDNWGHVPFRLCCTATPSPNDLMEIGNHCEFLGIMTMAEMLAMFFHHDGGETSKWTLKPHASKPFWKFVAQWAIYVRHPRDIGFDSPGYDLPQLRFHESVISDTADARVDRGEIVPKVAVTLSERREARKDSVSERIEKCAQIVESSPDSSWLIWCDLNAESNLLSESIRDSVEVKGSDSDHHKETNLLGFANGNPRRLVSKASIAGFGMNYQICHKMIFCGLSDSWERYYQAIRRCWRFGQKNPVEVYVITHEREGAVVENIKRKERQAQEMAEEMVANMREIQTENIQGQARNVGEYKRDVHVSDRFTLHLGDCVDVSREIDDESIDYTIFSPPFASLYTYTNMIRDMGNCPDGETFARHFSFLVGELFRITKPGRLLSFHCMNLPSSKERDGVIGLKDFRGELIRCFSDAGWIYHSEVCIWKDPVTAMQRTKALGLLHKTIRKDSSMSRQGIADYLVTMRKPGLNPEPISHTHESFPVSLWQRYASPVWMDINPNDTLQRKTARESDGERHICPLQLEVIRRAIDLWTNPDDLVFSPFAGIGSELYVALEQGRRAIGSELKQSYWNLAVNNLLSAQKECAQDIFAAVSP